jgi:MtN3 and saliva related transmembrane protein
MSQAIGFIAATLTALAFLPQVIKVSRTRSAGDLSMATLCAQATGVALWIVYGVSLRSMPVLLGNTVTLVLTILLMGFKIVYGR